jgi:anion-transporting  ArsA/GET3 family ATPase
VSKILIELEDLQQANNRINQVIHKLTQDEIYLRTIHEQLFGWKGLAGEEMRKRMNTFFNDLSKWTSRFEDRRNELVKYTERMRRLDEYIRR